MLTEDSRYYDLPDLEHRGRDGRVRVYKERRLIASGPHPRPSTTLRQSERLDLLTARTLKDSRLFWKICDANDIMNPFDLDEEAGLTILVPDR